MSDHNNENAVAAPADTRPQTRPPGGADGYWPRLEANRALVSLFMSLFLAIPTITISLYGLFRAMSADIKSEKTADELTRLQGSSVAELKTQSREAQSQTGVLSQQLAEQRTLSTRTAEQLDDVIVSLEGEIAHLAGQTATLSALLKQATKEEIFAVMPLGWWRDGSASLDDRGLQRVAHATLQSVGMTWSAKENALAFLSESGLPAIALSAPNTVIDIAEFHNEEMRNAVFSNSNLDNVLFSPAGATDKISLRGSDFNGSSIRNARFLKTDLSLSQFQNSQLYDVAFDSSNITRGKFRNADVLSSWFRNTNLDEADFSGTRVHSSHFICNSSENGTRLCSAGKFCTEGSFARYGPLTAVVNIHLAQLIAGLPYFKGPSFAGAQVSDTEFRINRRICGIDLSRAYLDSVSFRGQAMSNVDLERTAAIDVDFRSSVITDANAGGAWLLSSNFDGAQLDSVYLSGAIFDDGTFDGATLKNVWIDYQHIRWLGRAKLGAAIGENASYLFVIMKPTVTHDQLVEELKTSKLCAYAGFSGVVAFSVEGAKDAEEGGMEVAQLRNLAEIQTRALSGTRAELSSYKLPACL